MPVVDGFTFLVKRRQVPGCAEIPVVVVSGVHQPSELVGVLGVRAALAKPVQPDALLAAVDQLTSGESD